MTARLQILAAASLAGLLGAVGAEPPERVARTIPFPLPQVGRSARGRALVSLPGCALAAEPGKPLLPVAGATLEIPAGREVESLLVTAGATREIALDADVEWAQPVTRPGEPAPPEVPPDPAVYGGAAPYPADPAGAWRADPTDAGALLSVPLHPVRLDPLRGRLLAAESLTVTAVLRPREAADARAAPRAPLSLASALGPGPHSYVAVAPSNLLHHADPVWNLDALCDARARAGHTPAQVSIEWIDAAYAGADTPARLRAFAQDAHLNWDTRFLLLVGTHELIPTRTFYISFKEFFTDRTEQIPADALYYGCMDGTFDQNGNGRYGELNDGPTGGDVDLTAEILVGRFPVANAAELASLVRKTLRYESAAPADLRPLAFIAEKMDLGTLVYADGYMEELRHGSGSYSLDALGAKNSPYDPLFDSDRTLYDSAAYLWTTADALAYLNQNHHLIHHIGHGAIRQCVKIPLHLAAHQAALRAFTNEMPYFIYSQACQSGALDYPDCFAEQLVTVTNAAFAAVMNARDGWEYPNVVGGYSHRFHRAFWDAALRGSATRLGEINERSRRQNLHLVSPYSANYWRWVYYELNLFGDPATPFAAAVNLTAPAIDHVPLVNTYDTQTAYRVACTVEPVGLFDPDGVDLLWRTDREPGLTRTQRLSRVLGNRFEGAIEALPAHTRVDYAVTARSLSGQTGRWPAADAESTFHVTARLDLDLRGSPADLGSVVPDYGVHHFPSGLVAEVSAPALVDAGPDERFANRGFFGAGSAPQSGTNLAATFRMDVSSLLVWLWQRQYRLLLGRDPADGPDQTAWVDQGAAFLVPPAPALLTPSNSPALAFAEWRLDGARAPAAPGRSAPDFGPLPMDAPHRLEARYLPADLDADANGLADWWEFRYFGAPAQDPGADPDADGHTLAEEFADRSDPLDPGQVPAPPVIDHAPLAEIQTRPGPFTVLATITDTHAVSQALLRWRRAAEPWQETPLAARSNDLFEAQFAHAGAAGDDFEYQLLATDPSGRASQTPVYYTFLRYPVADTSRFHDLEHVALPTQTVVGTYMNLHNTGNADLTWSLSLARVESVRDTRLRGWDTASLGQPWLASTNRCASPPYALHARLVSGGLAASPPVRATITLPPLLIGANATLSFRYWIHSEPYQTTSRAFDGGIIEFSKDNGATFQQLKGPYTHTIYGWTYSPWPEGTPCLAGNGTEGWRTATFDFAREYPEENGFQGRTLLLRFHYGGDNNTDNEGWYLDDVAVTPLLWHPGFAYTLEPGSAFTVPAGLNARILWQNLPASTDARDDNLTVFLHSNDPAAPLFSFYWGLTVRDYPRLPLLAAAQSADGDGRVRLLADVCDDDGEPVSLRVDWSADNGRQWQPAALADLAAAFGGTPSNAPPGAAFTLATATNGLPATNTLAAVWASRDLSPPLPFSTQMLFRVTATNGYFGRTFTTAPFTLDNLPPAFASGALAVSPLSGVGPYALADGPLTLAWPAADDLPAGRPLTYRLHTQGGASPGLHLTNLTAATVLALTLSNTLDTAHTFTVTALDPAGNASEPLSATLLVLDAAGDADGDGLATADEEIAGTLATDPADRFVVDLLADPAKPGLLTLAWTGVDGRLYTVESTPTLQPPDWRPVDGLVDLPGAGAPLRADLPLTPPARFFRLRVRLP